MSTTFRRASLTAFAIAFVAFAPAPARADGPTLDCPTASEQGQRLRDDGKYLRAREMFRQCSRDACPGVVRKDCSKWLSSIEDSMPTLVVSVRDDDGKDVSGRLTIDGELAMAKLEGRPLTIDPGDHTLRFEAEGSTPVELRVIVQVGEKNRLVKLKLPAATKAVPADSVKTQPGTPPPDADTGKHEGAPLPIGPIVLGGVAVLALGSFAFFGLTGKSDLNNLKSTCAPFCAQNDLDASKTKLTIADISLGVAIVSVGVAAVLLFTGTSANKASTASVRPMPGGLAF